MKIMKIKQPDGSIVEVPMGKGADGYTPVKGVDYFTEADKAEIAEQVAGLMNTDAVPDYWKEHLDRKIATIKALQDDGGKDCFSFVVMTDMHYPSNLGKCSPKLAKRIIAQSDIRFAMCLGDVQTRGCHNTKEALLAENVEIEAMLSPIRKKLLQTEGNHDGSYGRLDKDGDGSISNKDSSGNIKPPAERETYVSNLTPAELHSAIYRKVGLVGDVHFDGSGSGYYIDDTANKVRYIVLNTQCNDYELQADGTSKYPKMWLYRFTQPQFDFVVDALNAVPADDWGVVVAGHCPLTNEIGDRELMKCVLGAYQAKDAYSGEYAGTASGGVAYKNLAEPLPDNTTDTTKWVNGYRFSSSGISTQSGTTISNRIACKPGDVIRIKGVELRSNGDRFAVYYTKDGAEVEGKGYWDATSYYWTCTQADDVYEITILEHDGYAPYAFRFAMPTPTDASSVIITVNQPIVEGGVAGYDAVSVNADFSGAKGNLVGYFAGHTHADSATVLYGAAADGAHAFPCITTRCDAHEENDRYNADGSVNTSGLWYQRDQAYKNGDKTQEQSFDVFTVNKAERKIYATKIGAGADREISY